MIENNIQVKLDRFDGPLALLLHLIQREEMSIRDLDINEITDEYLLFLKKMQNLNFDVAGEYLYMAATLLFIKSKSVAEDEERAIKALDSEGVFVSTKTELIEKLEELQKFQALGEKIFELPKRGEDIFVRPKIDRKSIQNSILTPMSLETLTDSMVDLIRREKRKYTVVKRDRLSIKEKLIELKNNLSVGSKTTLDKLINNKESTEETVITFISLLELARLQKLDVFQNEEMGEVYVEVKEALDSFDVETADGFDPEEEDNGITSEEILLNTKKSEEQQVSSL